ncbi:MAG: glycosyltransferase family 2 protein [Ignavibacteria bacterium]|jgi:GT2 family glycosyltransferase
MYYDLTIQIINYNTRDYLIKCIKGLITDISFCSVSYQIIVLDNNSEDDLSDLKEIFIDSDLEVYRSEINLGFGGGHNFLMKKAKASLILILNPDIEFVDKFTVSTLLTFLNNHPYISILGPRLIYQDGKTIEFDHGELTGLKSWYRNSLGDSYWIDRKNIQEVAWVSGAFFFIRKEVFENVKGFDENFFLYKEEEDLCLRVREFGYKVYYYPLVKVLHHTEVVSKKSDYIEESKRYYIKKNLEKRFRYHLLSFLRKIYFFIKI